MGIWGAVKLVKLAAEKTILVFCVFQWDQICLIYSKYFCICVLSEMCMVTSGS